ncbi:ATP synthase F1, epsilon subunit [Phakopsora pachyrhizi]|uniref:ATP synthase subunit delta, mitochondrial n=1 Tax=Phakopsora pachyrhizi TaxID=170000 RepID=A0AAV0B8T3_PHAPC|nr:ATP synthase F1, epsilon subunit [Phakopsora pachyrhizi]CAH7682553.1 ATP synthase F1, epsilon subunit [Phakopsora pachyrhizi]
MFGLKPTSVSRSILKALPRSSAIRPVVARRYATETATPGSDGRLQLSLVLPHETIYQSSAVTQVNISADSGDMGVLANHVASIENLRPGVVEVIETQGESKKWFVSGGFANVHPNNLLTINAVEAFPLEAFSLEAARSGLQDAQKALATGTEEQKAEASVEVEVFEALLAALK